jgi:hypothetical protein
MIVDEEAQALKDPAQLRYFRIDPVTVSTDVETAPEWLTRYLSTLVALHLCQYKQTIPGYVLTALTGK